LARDKTWIVWVDSITATGDVIAPMMFDSSADVSQMSVNGYQPVAGSRIEYIPEE
jgi:hypothetical protein